MQPPVESKRENAKSPTPNPGKGKLSFAVQKLPARDASPTTGRSTLLNRPSYAASPSPMRTRNDPTKSEESNLLKELHYYQMKQAELINGIQNLKHDVLQKTRQTFKQESEMKLKSAKLETEKNEIIDILVEAISKKYVVLVAGPERSKSRDETPPRRINDMSYRSNSFQVDMQRNENEISRTNRLYKTKIRRAIESVPGTVRVLVRNFNFNE